MTTSDETSTGNVKYEITAAPFKALYIVGGAAALTAAIIFRRWLGAEYSLFSSMGIFKGGPQQEPATVIEWFGLLQSNSLIALLFLNAFDLINYILVGLMFLGLFAALRNDSRGLMTLAIVIAFTGISVFFASNQAFSLLSLSRQYWAATTDADKAILLSAGQALITTSNPMTFGTGVFWAFILVTISGLIISICMLRGSVFAGITAYLGLLANAFGLGYFFTVAFSPKLTFIPLSASAPFLLIWYILVGIRLLKLSRFKGSYSK
jgi:hypothetical protein